jgi:hypothetical protein
MSIEFFITPYEPTEWQSASSTLRIDLEEFGERFLKQWPEGKTERTSAGGLSWFVPEKGSAGFFGELQSNQQIVSFGPGNWSVYVDFVLWYRALVPQQYRLFLFTSNSFDSLELTSETTRQDIAERKW